MTRALCLLLGLGAGLAIAARRNKRAWDAAEGLFNAAVDEVVALRGVIRRVERVAFESMAESDELIRGLELYQAKRRADGEDGRGLNAPAYDAAEVAVAAWETKHGHRWPTRTT